MPGDYKKHSYDKCRFPLYFILTARNTVLFGGYLLPHYISVSIYLVACKQALLGVGGGRGKEDPPPRELAHRLSIWRNWRCWRLSLLKDCRLYTPHSQIWSKYKLETASCFYLICFYTGSQIQTCLIHIRKVRECIDCSFIDQWT